MTVEHEPDWIVLDGPWIVVPLEDDQQYREYSTLVCCFTCAGAVEDHDAEPRTIRDEYNYPRPAAQLVVPLNVAGLRYATEAELEDFWKRRFDVQTTHFRVT